FPMDRRVVGGHRAELERQHHLLGGERVEHVEVADRVLLGQLLVVRQVAHHGGDVVAVDPAHRPVRLADAGHLGYFVLAAHHAVDVDGHRGHRWARREREALLLAGALRELRLAVSCSSCSSSSSSSSSEPVRESNMSFALSLTPSSAPLVLCCAPPSVIFSIIPGRPATWLFGCRSSRLTASAKRK